MTTRLYTGIVPVTIHVPQGTSYEIFVGDRKSLFELGNVMAAVPTPSAWEAQLREHLQYNTVKNTGQIRYSFGKKGLAMVAKTESFFPKANLGCKNGEKADPIGFSYLAEALTSHAVALDGVSLISTSASPSGSRISQLQRVGLSHNKSYPISLWEEKMHYGIKIFTGEDLREELESAFVARRVRQSKRA